ncbi:hypothetical protein B0F90DRAFT_1670204 [Multifurca ochricompacta]|uniref:MARVEL domain-containing protein n=1 Tax=Multifurca ochricompacta TaxID=376703 RepID=A0AAD4LY85_9AGAM|nr:hypothetical protein B0F90DRAFT_1670204 [Multifurca ochricompacta]
MAFLSVVRIVLYSILWAFSVVLLGLTAARIHYTESLSPDDPLNGGRHFYDPIVAELLATSILVMLWSMFAIHTIHTRRDRLILHTFATENIALFILFVMWLVGTAIATSMWGNLGWCHHYSPCRLLTALVAVAWTGWVFLFFLLSASLVHAFVNRAWNEPMHGHLYPRDSFAPPQTSEYRGSRL